MLAYFQAIHFLKISSALTLFSFLLDYVLGTAGNEYFCNVKNKTDFS